MLNLINVSKKFGKTPVLNNCNLTIQTGTIFGLVGINGAGKSTLLRSIAGIYELEEGVISFQNENTYLSPTIRKQILYLSDDPFYERTSSIASLKLLYKTFYAFDEEAYQKYLNLFHLREDIPIINFSKGMKRQVFLLFALAIKPKLLLLDEAFDGLDPIIRLNFKKALFELLSDEDITVIISSHNLKELEDICDSFGILENGQITTSGDLAASKDYINKYQLVFSESKTKEDFKEFDILHYSVSGRVHNIVIKGNVEEITRKLNNLNPLILDVLKVNFEELFIYEIESRGEFHE